MWKRRFADGVGGLALIEKPVTRHNKVTNSETILFTCLKWGVSTNLVLGGVLLVSNPELMLKKEWRFLLVCEVMGALGNLFWGTAIGCLGDFCGWSLKTSRWVGRIAGVLSGPLGILVSLIILFFLIFGLGMP